MQGGDASGDMASSSQPTLSEGQVKMKCWHAAREERGEGRSKYEGLWCVEDKREAKFFFNCGRQRLAGRTWREHTCPVFQARLLGGRMT
jgi:hypothetical protein